MKGEHGELVLHEAISRIGFVHDSDRLDFTIPRFVFILYKRQQLGSSVRGLKGNKIGLNFGVL